VANSNLLFAIVANHVVNIHRQFPAVYFTQFTILTTCCTQFLFWRSYVYCWADG